MCGRSMTFRQAAFFWGYAPEVDAPMIGGHSLEDVCFRRKVVAFRTSDGEALRQEPLQ